MGNRNSTTTLNDLNDECLVEVFKHLSLPDLFTVADVSSRFRRNAKIIFPRCSNFTFPYASTKLNNCYGLRKLSISEQITYSYRLLRLFNSSIRTFTTYGNFYDENCDEKLRPIYQRKAIEVLNQYCIGTLETLEIRCCSLSDENILEMRPLLEGIKDLFYGGASKFLLEVLPVWCPELRGLHLFDIPALNGESDLWKFSGLKKLDQMSFNRVPDLTNERVENLLKCHPKLKLFSISKCPNIDDRIIQVFADYGQGINALDIETFLREEICDPNTIGYGHFNNLKYLKLNFGRNSPTIESVFCELAKTAGALKSLDLYDFAIKDPARFVGTILKLEKLKKLKLYSVTGLTAMNISQICKNLSMVQLMVDAKLTGENLLQLIQIADNLEYLEICQCSRSVHRYATEKIQINVSAFEEMVKLTEKRSWRTLIILDSRLYTENLSDDLVKAHARTLLVQVVSPGWGGHSYPIPLSLI